MFYCLLLFRETSDSLEAVNLSTGGTGLRNLLKLRRYLEAGAPGGKVLAYGTEDSRTLLDDDPAQGEALQVMKTFAKCLHTRMDDPNWIFASLVLG